MDEKTKIVKDFNGNEHELFDDEILVETVSALGAGYGSIIFPKKVREGLISTFRDSGAIRSRYLFIDGKEIK